MLSDDKKENCFSGRANDSILRLEKMCTIWAGTCIKKVNQVPFDFILTLIWQKSHVCSIRFALAQTLSAKIKVVVARSHENARKVIRTYTQTIMFPLKWEWGMTFKSAGVEHIAGESHTVTSGHFLKKLIPKWSSLYLTAEKKEWFGHEKATSDCFWRGMR